MKVAIIRFFGLGLASILLPILVSAEDTNSGLSVPAKKIPVPTTVSPQLSKVIANPIPPETSMPTTALKL